MATRGNSARDIGYFWEPSKKRITNNGVLYKYRLYNLMSSISRDKNDSQNDTVIAMDITRTELNDDEDPIIINDEQLEEYQEMVEELGTFAVCKYFFACRHVV